MGWRVVRSPVALGNWELWAPCLSGVFSPCLFLVCVFPGCDPAPPEGATLGLCWDSREPGRCRTLGRSSWVWPGAFFQAQSLATWVYLCTRYNNICFTWLS